MIHSLVNRQKRTKCAYIHQEKEILVYPWRLTQSAFSKRGMSESLTLFLNKNMFIEKGITLS